MIAASPSPEVDIDAESPVGSPSAYGEVYLPLVEEEPPVTSPSRRTLSRLRRRTTPELPTEETVHILEVNSQGYTLDRATPMDGNCLFHAILRSGTRAYLEGGMTAQELRRQALALASEDIEDEQLITAAINQDVTPAD